MIEDIVLSIWKSISINPNYLKTPVKINSYQNFRDFLKYQI